MTGRAIARIDAGQRIKRLFQRTVPIEGGDQQVKGGVARGIGHGGPEIKLNR